LHTKILFKKRSPKTNGYVFGDVRDLYKYLVDFRK